MLVDDLKKLDVPYSLHFDETTSSQVKKQMDLTLRYWSPTHNEVWVNLYKSLFFGHAEGAKVAGRIYEVLKKDDLPVQKLCTLIRDGPNVNKTIFRKLEEVIKADYPDFGGFVDLGSCILHQVHSAFAKGMEEYGKDIGQLCTDVHSLFQHSAARREDYEELQYSMGVDQHKFQEHTEVRWLSLGPAVQRILEQWDCICKFVKDLGKDAKSAPKSISYKRVSKMLSEEEKTRTKAQLEFINNVSPVFEDFLELFQRSGPQIHILYDRMCEILRKLMARFLKKESYDSCLGGDLVSIDCGVKSQLSDSDIALGEATKMSIAKLKPDKRRAVFLSIRAFYSTSVSYVQGHLPLQNALLKALGCLNPFKRTKTARGKSITRLAKKLQPDLDTSLVQDEWRVYCVDEDVAQLDANQRVDHFRRCVFSLKSAEGSPRFSVIPKAVKSGLILAQMNAESERSLSINARIVTEERSHLGEKTIVGLRAVKDAVRFCDPVQLRPEKIDMSDALVRAVRSAHSHYRERLEQDKAAEKQKMAEKAKKDEEDARRKEEQKKMSEETRTLREREEILDEEEKEAMQEMETVDELLADGTAKLQRALSSSSCDTQKAKVAYIMIETAKASQERARTKLEAVREKQRQINKKQHHLLDRALPPTPSKKKKKN